MVVKKKVLSKTQSKPAELCSNDQVWFLFQLFSYNVTPLSLLSLKQNKREGGTHTWISLDTHT